MTVVRLETSLKIILKYKKFIACKFKLITSISKHNTLKYFNSG